MHQSRDETAKQKGVLLDKMVEKIGEGINEIKLKLKADRTDSPDLYRLPYKPNTSDYFSSDVFSVSSTSVSNCNSPSPSIISQQDTSSYDFDYSANSSEMQNSRNNSSENERIVPNGSTPKRHSKSKHKKDSFQKRKLFDVDSNQNNSYKVTRPSSRDTSEKTILNALGRSPKFVIRDFGMEYHIEDKNIEITNRNIFDSHCHLDRIFRKHRKDLKWHDKRSPPPSQALEILHKEYRLTEKVKSKFEGCISVCCDVERWNDEWYHWLTKEDNVWLTYGCHPANASSFEDWAESELLKLLSYPRVVALGEIGLDETYYSRSQGASLETQKKVFKRQLQIAKTMNKAVCIHLRAAEENGKVWKLAKQILIESCLPKDWKIHMHCFNNTLENALEWLKEFPNMKFGLISNSFQKDVGLKLDLTHILLETDAPYFASSYTSCCSGSKKKTPKYSIPGYVLHVAVQIAKIRDIPVDRVLSANRRNIESIYGIPYGVNEV